MLEIVEVDELDPLWLMKNISEIQKGDKINKSTQQTRIVVVLVKQARWSPGGGTLNRCSY